MHYCYFARGHTLYCENANCSVHHSVQLQGKLTDENPSCMSCFTLGNETDASASDEDDEGRCNKMATVQEPERERSHAAQSKGNIWGDEN